jgi:hypothetical protein
MVSPEQTEIMTGNGRSGREKPHSDTPKREQPRKAAQAAQAEQTEEHM